MVNMILCSMYNYVTMYRFTVTGCHRKTAACHVIDLSMCYCIHCFISVLNCTYCYYAIDK